MAGQETAFFKAMLERGVLTREQVQDCLETQKKATSIGLRTSLTEIALKKGYLSPEQVGQAAPKPDTKSSTGTGTRLNAQPIEGYQLTAGLGKGAFGVVYKAVQTSLKRTVAIKILPPKLAQNELYVKRFIREAQTAGKLIHPNVVQILDVGTSSGYYYYVMEYVPGKTVHQLLDAQGTLGEEEAIHIGSAVAKALQAASRMNLVHRDIKPSNIMVTPENLVKLTDFGIARELSDNSLTREGHSVGTPNYVSPEQAKGKGDVDARSDIYSLGATLYHLATGAPVFEAENHTGVLLQQVHEQPVRPRKKNPEVSVGLERIILKMLRKEPERRFQTPSEVLKAFELLAKGEMIEDEAEFEEDDEYGDEYGDEREEELEEEVASEGALGMLLRALACAVLGAVLVFGVHQFVMPWLESRSGDRSSRSVVGSVNRSTTVPPARQGSAPDDPSLIQLRWNDRLKADWEDVKGFIGANREQYGPKIARLEEFLEAASGSFLEDEVTELLAKIRKQAQGSGVSAFTEAQARANESVKSGEYGKAIAAFREIPESGLSDSVRDRVEAQIARITSLARSKWEEKRRLAASLVESDNLADARALLSSVEETGIAEIEGEVKAELKRVVDRIEETERAELAASRAKLEKVQRVVRYQCERLKYEFALGSLEKALADPELEKMKRDLQAEVRDVGMAKSVFDAVLKGAEKSKGEKLRIRRASGTILGTREGKILVKAGPAEMAVGLETLRTEDLIQLAGREMNASSLDNQLAIAVFVLRKKEYAEAKDRFERLAEMGKNVNRYLAEIDAISGGGDDGPEP